MNAGIFFTGTGPIVFMTSYDSFENPTFLEKLSTKGIKKFIAYKVPLDELQEKYQNHYQVIMGDLKQTDDLRVLDYNGHRIFKFFNLQQLGEPLYYEP